MKTTLLILSLAFLCSCSTCNLEKATEKPKKDYTAQRIVGGSLIVWFASILLFTE